MTITKTQLGRVLGYAALGLIILTLAYICAAFVAWSFNPGDWPLTARIFCVIVAVGLVVARLIVVVPDKEDDDAVEERR